MARAEEQGRRACRLRRSILIVLALFVPILIANLAGAFQYLELKTYDKWLLWERTALHAAPITVIGIDDDDITDLKQSQISDSHLERLVRSLEDAKPLVIGLDLVRDMVVPDLTSDTSVKQLVVTPMDFSKHTKVVGIMRMKGKDAEETARPVLIPPPHGLSPSSYQVGLADMFADDDGEIRRALLGMEVLGVDGTVPSFALRVAIAALHAEGIDAHPDSANEGGMLIGQLALGPYKEKFGPYAHYDQGGGQMLIDYKRRTYFRTFRLADVEKFTDSDRLTYLKDQIVLIGKKSEVDKDYFNTPISSDVFGVDLHAQIVDQLVRTAKYGATATRSLPLWLDAIWLLFCCLTGGFLGFLELHPAKFGLAFIIGCLLIGFLSFGMFSSGYWLPTVPTFFSFVVCTTVIAEYSAFFNRGENKELRVLLERSGLPKPVIERMRLSGAITGAEFDVTVLFTDIEGFSKIMDDYDVKVVMPWLTDYMKRMAEKVSGNHGIVNKYIGDAIMAVYGIGDESVKPDVKAEARNAVITALQMRDELLRAKADWESRNCGWPFNVKMRIGIHSGHAIAGSIGSKERIEYTVTGDIVNEAARLESLEKDTLNDLESYCFRGCRILIGQETKDLIEDPILLDQIKFLGDFEFHNMGKRPVYGVCGSAPQVAEPPEPKRNWLMRVPADILGTLINRRV